MFQFRSLTKVVLMGLQKRKSDGKMTTIAKSGSKSGAVKAVKKVSGIKAAGKVLSASRLRIRKMKVRRVADDNPFAVFTEWNGKADDDAYGSL